MKKILFSILLLLSLAQLQAGQAKFRGLPSIPTANKPTAAQSHTAQQYSLSDSNLSQVNVKVDQTDSKKVNLSFGKFQKTLKCPGVSEFIKQNPTATATLQPLPANDYKLTFRLGGQRGNKMEIIKDFTCYAYVKDN